MINKKSELRFAFFVNVRLALIYRRIPDNEEKT